MNGIINKEKIAFCITCMNRLGHLQQTLEKNIKDNYVKGNVEFILLDYNSQDGLHDWVFNKMKNYIDEGILIYYQTTEPTHYLRSHSRNMAFRLATASILCNLDADNFLGRGFANYMLKEFSKYDKIFYTSNYSVYDAFGRVCCRTEDFVSIRGYNETIKSYGFEDNDILNRLSRHGLKPMSFHDPEYYHFVVHPDKDRISEEQMAKNLFMMYIAYINPYTSILLLLYNDNSTEQYTIINNWHLYILSNSFTSSTSIYDSYLNDKIRTVIKGDTIKGTWNYNNETLWLKENGKGYKVRQDVSTMVYRGLIFHRVEDEGFIAKIFMLLATAINFHGVQKQLENNTVINADGFGKGLVYKNFNLSKKIILS